MPDIDMRAVVLALAILLDWVIGDPKRFYSYILHPVQFMGELLGQLEGWLNKPGKSFRSQKNRGVVALSLYLFIWLSVGIALTIIGDVLGWWGLAMELVITAVMLSGRSLYEHVRDVGEALKFKTVEEARLAVGQIVGRDTSALDDRGVARAAIESGAENLSDGFIAPVLFYLIGGLPGLLLYKAVNTADSMIGHKNQRFIGFGWAAARLDDLLNWVPARLSGLLITLLAHLLCGRGREAWRVMLKDAGKHSSPNAGWPEAAMAGAIGIAVAGPRVYRDMMKQDPWINAPGRLDSGPEDIYQALRVIKSSVFATVLLVSVIGLLRFI
ncbi:MAG: cobalamin biosynthesis protein CobD [Rhodomicrobium sp.]|nr:MAG: cobalamin biosynthesis protein CobD [Rhodomicrobium sp.]